MFEISVEKGWRTNYLMSNVNKVTSFSRLINEDIPSNILSRKGREIQPLYGEIEGIGPLDLRPVDLLLRRPTTARPTPIRPTPSRPTAS